MENRNCPRPLLFEKAAVWLVSKSRENKIPLLAALLFGLLAHLFAFTNKLLNHDEVFCLFSKGGTVSSGRWGLGALDSIFPNYSMPWIYGILTLILFAASVCVLIHIFRIRSKWIQVLLAGSIIVFPSLTGTFGYMFTSSSYGVAFLLSVLVVWFLQKGTLWNAAWALVCMVASLSIYQSYIAVTASLLVLVLIQELLSETDVLPVLRRGIAFVLFLAVSLAVYYGATQVILKMKSVTFNNYAASSMSFQLSAIAANVLLAYRNFFLFFSQGMHCLIPTEISCWMHCLSMGSAAVLLILWFAGKQDRKTAPILLLAALIAILPLAINCMYLFTSADSIHTLVLYSFVSVYLLVFLVADTCLPCAAAVKPAELCRRAALNLAALGMTLIVIVNIYIANASYLNLHLRYENACAFYTSLIADIKMTPGFDEDTKLAVIGRWEDPSFYEKQFAYTKQLTGVTGFKPDSYSGEAFLEYYLGFPIPFATDSEIDEIRNSPEFVEMATYPYYGSLQKMGDILVVKLS